MSLSRPFHFLNVRGFATASTSRALSQIPQRHLSTAVSNPSGSKAWYRRTWQPQLPEKALPLLTKAGKRALHTTPVCLHGSITRPAPGTGIKVHFKDAKGNPLKTVEVNEGDDILSIAHEHDIDLEGACEGSVACSTCHVILSAEHYDQLPEPSDDENDMLDMAFGLTDTSRLGCQVQVTREMEGMNIGLPSATRNMFVDGHKATHH